MKKGILFLILISLTSCGKRLPSPEDYYGEIQGTWKSNCFAEGDGFKIQSMVFNELSVNIKEEVFFENSCTSKLYELNINSNYSLGYSMDFLLEKSIQISYTTGPAFLTLMSDDVTNVFNSEARCSFTDWITLLGKKVNGKTCVTGDKTIPNENQRYLNLIKIEDNKLHLGNDRCELNNSCQDYYGQKYPKEYYPNFLIKQ